MLKNNKYVIEYCSDSKTISRKYIRDTRVIYNFIKYVKKYSKNEKFILHFI